MTDIELKLGVSMTRDALEVEKRSTNEGLGYLGLVLPRFWSWFVNSLDAGKLLQPPARFKTSCGMADRPAFLQELTLIVFGVDGSIVDPGDDKILAERIALTVKSVNTICNSFGKKYEAPLAAETRVKILQELHDTDVNGTLDISKELLNLPLETQRIITYARNYLCELFKPYSAPGVNGNQYTMLYHDFWEKPVIPRFGPGACAERFSAYQKYENLFANPPLRAIHPLRLYDLCSASPSCNSGIPLKIITEEEIRYAAGKERTVDLTIVPKTIGKGRDIAPQENDYMFIQEGYMHNIYEWVENHPLTHGFINFRDQGVNGKLALQASADRLHATLDLSKASNMVTKGHVGLLFDQKFSEMLLLLRNDRLRYKVDGEEVSWNMNMYAPMGSALCFPVEALVFWAIAKAALDVAHYPGNRDVYVFGDDILVSNDAYETVCRAFSSVGFHVNLDKSFHRGYFRESCGVDAYKGYRVNPEFRISKRIPSVAQKRHKRAGSIAAWVDYANMAEVNDNIFLAEAIRSELINASPRCRSFPATGEIQETNEGYLAFYVGELPSIRDNLAKKVKRPSSYNKVVLDYPLQIRKKWTGGHTIFDEYRVNVYMPPFKGAQGTFFGPSVQAPSARLYVAKTREEVKQTQEDQTWDKGSIAQLSTMPDELAYLRWAIEGSENVRRFPLANSLDVVYERVTLS
jgi:hypothetical protein